MGTFMESLLAAGNILSFFGYTQAGFDLEVGTRNLVCADGRRLILPAKLNPKLGLMAAIFNFTQ